MPLHVDPATLVAALSQGVVPPEVAAAPVGLAHQDGIHLDVREPGLRERLLAAGFTPSDVSPTTTVPCWAAAIPPVREALPPPPLDEILLGLPGQDMAIAGRLLALGCARQRLMQADGAVWVRALDPPYYEVLRALEAGQALRRAGARVWVQLGWAHPLVSQVNAPEGHLWLVGPDGWRAVPDGPWTDLFDAIELRAPAVEPVQAQPLPARLQVPLQLVRGPAATAQMWVLDAPRALPSLERLVRDAPSALIQRLSFLAWGPAEQPSIVLVGPANEALSLPLEGPGHAPYGALPNLFLPVGTALAPPLGRARLAAAVAPDPDQRYWVVPTTDGFRVQAAPLSAFAPLHDWVDHLASVAPELDHWVRSATFDFDDFVVERSQGERSRRSEKPREEKPKVEPKVPSAPAPEPTQAGPRRRRRSGPRVVLSSPDEAAQAFDDAARAFCADDSPQDSPHRVDSWAQLADLAQAAGRTSDAALCRARALWLDESSDLAAEWAGTSPAANLLGQPIESVLDAQKWLAENARALDLRTHWLVRLAVSRAAGGDRLALLRSRDQIMAQLRDGLPISREVPAFVRAQSGGTTPQVRSALETLRHTYREAPRKRHMLEADPELTHAYVDLVFAWGFARLGETTVAQSLADEAEAALPMDELHAVCVGGFRARIEEAALGQPHGGPLSGEARAALETFPAYKADRLWNASFILAPATTEDAAARFLRTRRGEEDALDTLAAETDSTARARLWDEALDPPDPLRWARLADLTGTLPTAARGPRVARLLDGLDALEPAGQAQVLLELTRVADAADDTELMARTVTALRADLEVYAAQAPIQAAQLLRRFARLPGDHTPLFDELREALPQTPEGAIAAVHVATDAEAALAAFDAALPVLSDASPDTYGRRVRALAQGLTRTDVDTAIDGVERLMGQLRGITDSLQTSSHFCLSVVRFMESMVLALVDEGLSLSPWARRWIAEDEHLLRRRIYRDTVGESG